MNYYTGIGSRTLPDGAEDFITELATYMQSQGVILRSGDDYGADTAFQAGAGDLFETWVPWRGFAKGPNRSLNSQYMFNTARNFLITSGIIPWFDRMTPASQKFHARNYRQIIGEDELFISKACFYCAPINDDGEPMGGTRTAVLVAKHFGVPTFNLFTEEERELVRQTFMENING